jgi:long-chain fatty acid transport protein
LRSLRLVIVSSLACLLSIPAFGSGFLIPEQGAKASGMAGAFVATADDPSAIFYNPAGIAQQREMAFFGGTTFINFTNEFVGDPNDPFTSGVEAKYDRHLFNVPNVYGVIPIGNNLTLGVGAFAAFGLRTDWAEPFPGRYISQDADLKTMSFQPTLAWQTTDGRFAVGAGVEYRRARVILNANRMSLNPFTGRLIDVANTRLASEYGDDLGYSVGVLWKPNGRFRVGAAYRTNMDIELEGDAEITQISSGNAQLDALVASQLPPDQRINTVFPFPGILQVGVAFKPAETWDVELDVMHTEWSAFDALAVNFETTPSASFVREQNWEDSNSYRLGINKKATEAWDVRFGAVYDENPQPTQHVSPLLPDADRIGVTIGTGWHGGPIRLDWSVMVLHFQDRDTEGQNTEGFNGTYQTDAVLWSINAGYRF